ncbi:MAG: FecR domain-containing protein [Planctomycetota bacterium]
MSSTITLMLRYLDGDSTEQETAELDRLVADSPDAARMLARLAIEQSQYGAIMGSLSNMVFADDGHVQSQIHPQTEDLRFAIQHASERQEAEALLQQLLKMEQMAARVDNSQIDHPGKTSAINQPVDSFSANQLIRLGPYVFTVLARSKPLKWFAATAALIAVATTIYFIFGSGQETIPDPIADQARTDDKPAVEPSTLIVASLTAEREAVWDRQPGLHLYAGQRFTLSHGFAEITTNSGAVALLEAPCSIELTSDENTLLLNDGKLIGLCQTEASRGFVVQTPDAQIVDIGTEFGVIVQEGRGTRVQVFGGEVRVTTNQADEKTRRAQSLTTQQAVWIPPDQGDLVRIDFDKDAFGLHIVEQLDIVDIVAGGNGLGGRSGMAIDLATGRFHTSEQIALLEREAWPRDTGMTINPIEESAFIDSVFIIDRFSQKAKITSDGGEFEGFPTMPQTINSSDANGFIQATPANTVINPPSHPDYQRPFAQVGRQDLDGHYVVIHAGSGITFDLNALKSEHSGAGLARFKASALNIEKQSIALSPAQRPATADIWVIVDGKQRFLRRSTNTETGVIEIDVNLNKDDRFLTLAVSHGGDGSFHDWVVFARPQIEIQPPIRGLRE